MRQAISERLIRTPCLLGVVMIGIALFSLGFAYISQYGFGLYPCQLCLYQRIPYYALLIIGILVFFMQSNIGDVMRLGAFGVIALLAVTGLAFFHMGVEYGWWEGTEACGAQGMVAESVEQLKSLIMNTPVVKCTDPAFVFLGLSMAGWNMVWSFFAAIVLGWLTVQMRFGLPQYKLKGVNNASD